MGRARTRVLRVIARMNMGGPAYHVGLLSGLLDQRGYETLLLTGEVGPGEASMAEVADAYGATRRVVHGLRPELDAASDARALMGLIRTTRAFRPAIVHTHTAKAGFLGRLAALSLQPRPAIVHTYHGHVLEGYFGPTRTAGYRQLETAMARVSDRLIGVSTATVDDLVRLKVASRERFSVIPLGLELGEFLSGPAEQGRSFRREVGVSDHDVLLVYVGRMVPIKRLDVMLRAFAAARGLGARVRLALVGDGPSRPKLQHLARALGTSETVWFAGYRRDLAQIAAAADIGVLSSDNEGTPVSLIEMAAAGRPLLATRAGGVPDVVAPGCGILVAPGDHRSLGDAIVALAADPARRRSMGEAAREQVRDRFSVSRLLNDVEALYEELVDRAAS